MQPPSAHSPQSETGPWFFCLRHAVHAGAIGIVMVGELDVAAADDARVVISRAQASAAEVICDLHDVSFIDPCGLHVLLDAAASARRHNARLTFANPSPCVRRLIDLVDLDATVLTDAARSPAPPARAERHTADRRARSRDTPALRSTPLIVRSSLRAARQDRRR